MKPLLSLVASLSLAASAVFADNAETFAGPYVLGPDSLPQEGVPRGRLEGPFELNSHVIPDTARRYWIFVPAQYDASEPAGLLVFQDGQRATAPQGSLRVPQVMENLIAKGDMPVSIGVFVTPGNKSQHYPDDLGMSNPNHRAQEYDALSDDYSRMLLDELLPVVGKQYRITDDPSRRVIGGTSSGAICAFTVAWRHPESFGKVISFIGSYVSIGFRPNETPIKLGGQDYPALIRREPIRPIKIFMQDGSNDLDNEWGNWFLANQQMLSALNFANRIANRIADRKGVDGPRYQVRAVWTDGRHSDEHGGVLLPEAIRWLYAE